MNIEKLEDNIHSLVTNLNEKSFIYDLLLAYEQPKSSITRLQKGDYNLSKIPGEILWKKKLLFKEETDSDLHGLIDKLKSDSAIMKHHPRFLIVTDFETLLSVDSRTGDTLDIPITDLSKYFDFFLPWAGMEKSQLPGETLADIKAAEHMGRLYDLILADNPAGDDIERHALNIFFSRLLFCFFAEDTGIFNDNQFTNAVASHTAEDGSNLQTYLQKLFKVLSVRRRSDFPKFLQDFPYVNGGLFADEYPVPIFSSKSRKIIIDCGSLNWKAINPDIFGSMIQAVVHDEQRGSMGMHYTSVVNIMKVIEPLFLNDLRDELEQAGQNKKKLTKLLDRLYHLRIFDPACGSGNFLIIAYKELCKLEIEIFRRLHGDQTSLRFKSNISLTQFYGIELDDFAHETAKLSLWLAEHQMNLAFKEVFGIARPTLPLQDGGYIVCGNATRLDWEEVCPKDEGYEIYILGNPPYSGYSKQTIMQREDMSIVFSFVKDYKKLDYIACWFYKGTNFISGTSNQLSFVTTNSICQGIQVALLWRSLFELNIDIMFAHLPFKWSNYAKFNAGVYVVIIGLESNNNKSHKIIFDQSRRHLVQNINPYLVNAKNVFVQDRRIPLAKIPRMVSGLKAGDDGNLILSEKEKEYLLEKSPNTKSFIKRYIGAKDFMNGINRYCIWVNQRNVKLAYSIPLLKKRFERLEAFRLASKKQATRKKASTPYAFDETNYVEVDSIIVPQTGSERREYLPIGFLNSDYIISNGARAIYDAKPWLFALHQKCIWYG